MPQVATLITTIVNKFPNLQKDTSNIISIPKLQYIEIPLLNNQEDLYKLG